MTSPPVVQVDESMVTGEPMLQTKTPGEQLFAGSLLRSAQPIFVRAIKTYADSTLSLMKQTLEVAMEKKANLERVSVRYAADFTPFTLVVAAVAFWLQRRQAQVISLATWGRTLAVLMAATPCPAAIGVPIAFLCGMSVANK
jgi:cation transport ATPase